jgi:hypothetical protein
MSIIYTGEVEIDIGQSIRVHAFDDEHGNPSVLVTIAFPRANLTLHLSPENAESLALHLSQASAIASKSGEKS